MNHLPHLISDLALILIVAGVTTLLFKQLKQPVVLGYILAGLIVGPKFPLFPTITEIENIRIWADIGVIFLLFTLGLEFSFKKLVHIGGAASVTGLTEIFAMLVIGFMVGKVLGWPTMDCIFLGGILSIASTTIIIRTFDELGVKKKKFAELVFGVLIIEDLVAVVLLVLLSTIAVSREFAGVEMVLSIVKLAFFLILWFVAGIFFIPSFLSKVKKHLNDETMLVLAIGLCLTMVLLASQAGFSPALGAFIMGSILAETIQAERIDQIITPVKDLFGAVFFVSVGMLIDPSILVEYALPILLITVVLIVSKVLSVTTGALISGQPLKTSMRAAMSMGQIGEFSFIIATLGVTLNVTSKFLYPIAVAVSAITTFTTPYMVKSAGRFYNVVDKRLPKSWKKVLVRYSTGAQSINNASDWQLIIRSYLLLVLFVALIVAGIIFLFRNYVLSEVILVTPDMFVAICITAFACLVIISPFLWALVNRKLHPVAFANLWANQRFRGPLLVLRFLRIGMAIVLVSALLISFFPIYISIFCVVGLVLLSVKFSKQIHSYYLKIEDRFFHNFNSREIHEAQTHRRELAPWDAHIIQYTVPVGSRMMGEKLGELELREKLGVNVAMIKRGELPVILAPGKQDKIFPGDKIFVIGTDEQLDEFKNYLDPEYGSESVEKTEYKIVLKKVELDDDSPLIGVAIKDSKIREVTKGLVVGIERGGRRLLNPESDTVFEAKDLVWLVGDSKSISEFRKDHQPKK